MKVTVRFCDETKDLFTLGLVNVFDVYKASLIGNGWAKIIDDNGEELLLWENEWEEWTDES